MKHGLPLLQLIAICAAVTAGVWAQESSASPHSQQPVVVRSTFADGMVDGWESYPWAEDDGYDPTLMPIAEADFRGIERMIAPAADGPAQLGFIRRLNLNASPGSRISFRYKIQSSHSGAQLCVQLFSGQRVRRWMLPARRSGWQQVQMKLSQARGETHWTALAIVLKAPHEIRDTQLSFSLANVALSGRGHSQVKLVHPAALWDEARAQYYLHRSYRQGERIGLAFAAPARVTLRRPDGSVAFEGLDCAYSVGSSDPAGVWSFHAVSDGAEASGQLLVEQERRPGLLFDTPPYASDDLLHQIAVRRDELAAKVHVELGANIAQFDSHWLLPGLSSYFQLLVPPSELALYDAILFRYRNDRHALKEAQMLLRGMSAWPTWVHPWFPAHGQRTYYPVGLAAANVAIARMFLGDSLSEADARLVDAALLKQAVVPAFEEYVAGNRLPFSVSNWIGNTVGGGLLAALTIGDANTAGYILALLARDREHLRAAYTRDGDYGEGTSYLRFDLEMSSLVAAAVARQLKVDLEPDLGDASRYLRNAIYGDRKIVDFGDTHTELVSTDAFAYLAAFSPGTEAAAFYRAYRTEQAERPLLRLLWDEAAMRRAPGAEFHPSSAMFPLRGTALLRSGPETGATIVAMRAGANFNHNHADQGEVQIDSGGRGILSESGYADYYKDPSFSSYVTQAAGHNVLLLDDLPASQVWPGNRDAGQYPVFLHDWLGDHVRVAAANLASAYGNALSAYERWVIAPHNGAILIVDRVQAKVQHRYTALWHTTQQPIAISTSAAPAYKIGPREQSWILSTYGSEAIGTSVEYGPLPLAEYARAESQIVARPAELSIRTQVPLKQFRLLTVVAPPQETAEYAGSTSPVKVRFTPTEIVAEAPSWKLRLRGGQSSRTPLLVYRNADTLLLLEMRTWAEDGRSIEASEPVDVEFSRGVGGIVLRLRSTMAGQLSLHGLGASAHCVGEAPCPAAEVRGAALVVSFIAGEQSWLINPDNSFLTVAP